MKPTHQLHGAGQGLWLDNITCNLLGDDTTRTYNGEHSITGLTSNPTIFDKAIECGPDYDADIATGATPQEVFFELALSDLRRPSHCAAPQGGSPITRPLPNSYIPEPRRK